MFQSCSQAPSLFNLGHGSLDTTRLYSGFNPARRLPLSSTTSAYQMKKA